MKQQDRWLFEASLPLLSGLNEFENEFKCDEPVTTPKSKNKISDEAIKLLNEGCHFLNGAKGNRPGMKDGHSMAPDNTRLHPLRLNLEKPFVQTAMTSKGICCGRFGRIEDATHKIGREINREELKWMLDFWKEQNLKYKIAHKYLLPMAYSSKGKILTPRFCGNKVVLGESCLCKRHFDCVGFVNYCIAKAHKKDKWQYSISQYRGMAKEIVGLKDLMDGDILVTKEGEDDHVGIVWLKGSDAILISSSSYKVGVVPQKLNDNLLNKKLLYRVLH